MAESISASADRHDLSDDEREGVAALINSPLDFIRMTLKIQNKRQELVPLEPNLPQQMFYDEYRRQEEAGRPVRIIILKARQMGFSTMTSALFYWEDDRHAVIINREQLALDEKNPFWHGMKPYDRCCYVPLSNEFYGMGIPEMLAGLQAELNTTRNMRLDYNAMAMRRMWKIRKGYGLTARDLVWRQNGVIELDDMEDIQEINVQELSYSAFTNEDVIKQDMRDTTGVHDIVMGLSEADETATTTATKDNNANLRFQHFIEAVVEQLLVPIAKKCLALDQQYLEESRIFRLLNEEMDELYQVDAFDIAGDYDTVSGDSTVPKWKKGGGGGGDGDDSLSLPCGASAAAKRVLR